MALLRRALARRGRRLSAVAALALPLILCGRASQATGDAATARRTQIAALERMLVSAPAARSAERLLRLAELYDELATLSEGPAVRVALDRAATTCRQLLVDHPRSAGRSPALLLLARVELRRENRAAAREAVRDLERLDPRSEHRCAARLVAGDAASAAGAYHEAAAWYRRVRQDPGCGAHRAQGSYRLAWSLIRAGATRRGAAALERLLADRDLDRQLRERVLSDLTLAWTADSPPAGAARLLLAQAGARRGWTLVEQTASRLLAQGRLGALLRFAEDARATLGARAARERLWHLRLDGVARLGSPALLARELDHLRRSGVARTAELRIAAAAALLAVARRQHRDPAAARPLYERLISDHPGTHAAAAAQRWLGDLALEAGDLDAAARRYGQAAAHGEGALRAEARYRQVYALQQLAREASGGAAARFARAAQAFLVEHADHREARAVRLALADTLLRGGDPAAALLHARALLAATSARLRGDALRTALDAAERLGDHATSYALAHAELQRCMRTADDEPGLAADSPAHRAVPPCPTLAAAASRAALLHAQGLATRRQLHAAQRWAGRATAAAVDPADRAKARWVGAAIAARAGDVPAARRIYGELGTESPERATRRRALLAAADLDLATARFAAAAAALRAAAAIAEDEPGRLKLLARAAEALLDGGDRAEATGLLRDLARQARRSALPPRWPLRFGAQLARVDTRGAHRYFLRAAHALPPVQARLAAELLLAAAEQAPPRVRLHLARRAVGLAGPLRRRGKVSTIAARAAISAAAAEREVLRTRRGLHGKRGSAALERYAAGLVPLVLLRHPRWSAAAGLHLAWALRRMATLLDARIEEPSAPDAPGHALRARAAALRRELAAIARRPDGLNRFTLAAARGPRLTPLRLAQAGTPPAAQAHPGHAPALRLVLDGQAAAALQVSDRALALFGEDAALRCVRAAAQAQLGRPERSWAELTAALAHDPRAACAQENLRALATQRGDVQLADALLTRGPGAVATAPARAPLENRRPPTR